MVQSQMRVEGRKRDFIHWKQQKKKNPQFSFQGNSNGRRGNSHKKKKQTIKITTTKQVLCMCLIHML